ncbi:MAG: helix-turn-helix domain-containing protein [Lachnospiraceae bacterium]
MHSVGQVISNNRKKMGLSQPELAAALKKEGITISYKAISSWEKNVSEPSVTTFLILCRLLEIPDVYESYFGSNPGNPLSKLNEEGKAKILDYLSLLILSGKYEKKDAEITAFPSRKIRLYSTLVSAGIGNFLDSEDFELIDAGAEVPPSADFGITITGDSMEPRYVDGQIVWVHQQDDLKDGEVGIFYLNHEAYCKKLQDDGNGLYLISLNSKYPPKPVDLQDEFKIFGKVIG